MAPSDEDLVKIAYREYHNGDDALWSDEDDYEYWLAVARALRAALEPERHEPHWTNANEQQYLRWLDEAAGEQRRLETDRDNWRENCERVQRHLQYSVAEVAALKRDRARLLAYVRAEERVRATDPLQGTGPYVAAVQERDAARRAVIDAGLLEGDDDGE